MKNKTYAFGPMAGYREDGAPVDYARNLDEECDPLAETDIVLVLDPEKEKEKKGFDPYNSAGG